MTHRPPTGPAGPTGRWAAERWVAERLPSQILHLDAAACGRVSRAGRRAELAHLSLESQTGGYVAHAQAGPLLAAGRAALGAICGLSADDVAYTANGTAGFADLLAAWPLPRGARVGWVRGDYASNTMLLGRLASERGWDLVDLPVDRLGRVLDVPADLDLVTLPQVASQRGVLQPVAEVLAASDAPLLLDVAQSAGQVQVVPGCAAYVGTSRKWLCGPRGAGFVAVSPEWEPRLGSPPTLSGLEQGVARFDPGEARIASRSGLAVAAEEWDPDLLPVVASAAARARQLLDGVAGWRVVEPFEEPTGITSLVPPAGADPAVTRARLIEVGILTSAVPATRALDLDGPVLRISTAAWVQSGDVARLAAALPAAT